jgi:hypothetical protein
MTIFAVCVFLSLCGADAYETHLQKDQKATRLPIEPFIAAITWAIHATSMDPTDSSVGAAYRPFLCRVLSPVSCLVHQDHSNLESLLIW